MSLAQRMREDESAAPIDMLAALFQAHGWACEVGRDELNGEVQGSWVKYQVKAIWRAEDNVLQILCLPDIHVSKPQVAACCELLSLINEQTWLGHFEMWSNGGILLYRNANLLTEEGLLGPAQAQMLIETAVQEWDRFYPAFQFVLWGGKPPVEALAAAMVDAAGEA